MEIKANLVDIDQREIYPVKVVVKHQKITSVTKIDEICSTYILPGFIDAHIHIESSMLPPSEFARLAVRHGTVATVSDPHEIANILGIEGVEFMLENAEQVNFKFYFGASPCVPATPFETSGATLGYIILYNKTLRDLWSHWGFFCGTPLSHRFEKFKINSIHDT